MTYNESLEKHVEELQERLADAETTIAKISNPYVSLSRRLQDDDDYAWTFHCNIAVTIRDELHVDNNDANKAAIELMRHLFNATRYLEKYTKEIKS